MKFGDKNTFKGKQIKKHGKTVKPAMCRYFSSLRWLENAKKRLKRHLKKTKQGVK